MTVDHKLAAASHCWILTAAVLALAAGRLLATPAASDFDDLPAPFVASKARSEAEIDRIEAWPTSPPGDLQERGDFAQAIRHFARADRLDPAATAARNNLVLAAVVGKQLPLAVRYALKGVDPTRWATRPWLSWPVSGEEGELDHAIEFYEKALIAAHPKGDAAEAARSAAATNAEGAADIFTRLELGRLYHLTQKYAKAAEQFVRVNEALEHPDRFGLDEQRRKLLLGNPPGECYELFGEAYLLRDRLAEAEAAFRQSQSIAPNDALLKFNLARIAARRGQAQEALSGLEACIDHGLTSEGTAPYQLLADVLKKLGKEGELLDRLQKLHAADAANALLSYFLADQYLKAGRTELAEPLYLELSVKNPTMLAYRSLASIYRKGGQYGKLLALLGKVMNATGGVEVLGTEDQAADDRCEAVRRARGGRPQEGRTPGPSPNTASSTSWGPWPRSASSTKPPASSSSWP